MGIPDYKKKYNIDEIIKGDTIFCATAITNGDLLKGIKDKKDHFEANTFVLHKNSKTNKKITNTHQK